MKPIVTLPEARKYFQRLVKSKKVRIFQHCTLLQDVLVVLATQKSVPLVKQMLWGEFNEVMNYAQSEKLPWLEKNLNRDGWIDLNEYVVFQGVNCALAGILTTVATLPWQMELSTLIKKSE